MSPPVGAGGGHLYDRLGIRSRALDSDSAETVMPVDAGVRSADALRSAVLGLVFEHGVACYALPRASVVPTEISLHVRDRGRGVAAVRSVTRLVRAGRSALFVEGEIHGVDDGRLIAFGSSAWAVVGPPGSPPAPGPPTEVPPGPPILEATGITADPDVGGCRLDELAPWLLGPGGVLHAGVYQLMAEEAALVTGRPLLGASVVTTDATHHFLAPGRRGPFRAVPELVHHEAGSVDCAVRVRDEGDDDRLCAQSYLRLTA